MKFVSEPSELLKSSVAHANSCLRPPTLQFLLSLVHRVRYNNSTLVCPECGDSHTFSSSQCPQWGGSHHASVRRSRVRRSRVRRSRVCRSRACRSRACSSPPTCSQSAPYSRPCQCVLITSHSQLDQPIFTFISDIRVDFTKKDGVPSNVVIPRDTDATTARARVIAALGLPANYSELSFYVLPYEKKSEMSRLDSDEAMRGALARWDAAADRVLTNTPSIRVYDILVCCLLEVVCSIVNHTPYLHRLKRRQSALLIVMYLQRRKHSIEICPVFSFTRCDI